LTSIGIDVRGIDLDAPLLRFGPAGLWRIYKKNGLERTLKTTVRSILFDKRERSALGQVLNRRGHCLRIEPHRFLVGDAVTHDFGTGTFDLIYSEDVFEHIPPKDVETLVARLPKLLAPKGVVIIAPDIFTGITGGHLTEWYCDQVGAPATKRSEPWEHLRKRRFAANTYLNRLTRAEYRSIFSQYLRIIEEVVVRPDLGKQWLTPEVQRELSEWTADELFSNKVRFVLAAT
jgi:hypothetical protein